jgi:hypothetical protein
VFWRGGPQKGGELPAGRVGSVFFSPQKDYAEQYGEGMGGTTYPYLLRTGRQYDPANNPEHEADMAERFRRKGGWQRTVEDNYAMDEEDLAGRAYTDLMNTGEGPGNPYNYMPGIDEQWEVLDEPETDILGDVLDDYDSARVWERRDEGYEGVMMPDNMRNGIRRLDAEFNPDNIDSKDVLAGVGAGAVGLGALAMPGEAEAAVDPDAWMNNYQPELMTGLGAYLPENVQAGILGAGEEASKLVEGGKDLFDWMAGNEEARAERRTREETNDKYFDPVAKSHPMSVLAGSMLPYFATGGLYGAAAKAGTPLARGIGAAAAGAGEGGLRYATDPWERGVNAGLGALFAVGGPAAAGGIKNYFNPKIPDWYGF